MSFIERITPALNMKVIKGDWEVYDILNSDGIIFTSTFVGIIPCYKVIYRNKEFDIDYGKNYIESIMKKFSELVGVDTSKQWRNWNAKL